MGTEFCFRHSCGGTVPSGLYLVAHSLKTIIFIAFFCVQLSSTYVSQVGLKRCCETWAMNSTDLCDVHRPQVSVHSIPHQHSIHLIFTPNNRQQSSLPLRLHFYWFTKESPQIFPYMQLRLQGQPLPAVTRAKGLAEGAPQQSHSADAGI